MARATISVVPIDDFLLAGAFAALFEQLDGVFAFGFQRMPLTLTSTVAVDSLCGWPPPRVMDIPPTDVCLR